MYRKLESEMILNGFNKKLLSEKTKIPYTTLTGKLNKKSPITLDEAQLIKNIIGTQVPLDELFEIN